MGFHKWGRPKTLVCCWHAPLPLCNFVTLRCSFRIWCSLKVAWREIDDCMWRENRNSGITDSGLWVAMQQSWWNRGDSRPCYAVCGRLFSFLIFPPTPWCTAGMHNFHFVSPSTPKIWLCVAGPAGVRLLSSEILSPYTVISSSSFLQHCRNRHWWMWSAGSDIHWDLYFLWAQFCRPTFLASEFAFLPRLLVER